MTRKFRILVVDDDQCNRELFRDALVDAGYEVETAVSGDDALDMIGRRRYDLVTTDKRRPGMDGYTLRERIHERFPWLPVVLITGDPEMNSVEEVRRGFTAALPKPIPINVLAYEIDFILSTTGRQHRPDLPATQES